MAKHKALKLLFIGNSFTRRNDLPGMIAALAATAGEAVEHELFCINGASLKQHWNRGEAKAAIERGGWDYVVLQEQSTLPFKNATRMHENVRLFDELIKQHRARTGLYLTWARKHSPEKQALITEAYESIGNELGATVIPVGKVWEKFLQKHDEPALHDADESHPSVAGSFLAACVFVAALFPGAQVGIPDVAKLDPADRRRIIRAAGLALRD